MNLGRDQLEEVVEDEMHLFGVAPLGHRRKPRKVGEQHRYLAPFTVQCGTARKDLVRHVPGRLRKLPRFKIAALLAIELRNGLGTGNRVSAGATELCVGPQRTAAIQAL